MSTDAETLAALDFTPAPMQCNECDRRAQGVAVLTCGCRSVLCSTHASRLYVGGTAGALVCHTHRMHGVRMLRTEGL